MKINYEIKENKRGKSLASSVFLFVLFLGIESISVFKFKRKGGLKLSSMFFGVISVTCFLLFVL